MNGASRALSVGNSRGDRTLPWASNRRVAAVTTVGRAPVGGFDVWTTVGGVRGRRKGSNVAGMVPRRMLPAPSPGFWKTLVPGAGPPKAITGGGALHKAGWFDCEPTAGEAVGGRLVAEEPKRDASRPPNDTTEDRDHAVNEATELHPDVLAPVPSGRDVEEVADLVEENVFPRSAIEGSVRRT